MTTDVLYLFCKLILGKFYEFHNQSIKFSQGQYLLYFIKPLDSFVRRTDNIMKEIKNINEIMNH